MRSFWNEVAVRIAQKAWLPVNTTSVKYRHDWYSMARFKNNGDPLNETWFEFRQPRVSPPSGFKAKKIMLLPSEEQKTILDGWFDDARWTYNKCLEVIKEQKIYTRSELRAQCLHSDALKEAGFEFVLKTPYDIRDYALTQLLTAHKACFANLANGNIAEFDIKFRKKKSPRASIIISARNWKNGILYPRSWNEERLRGAEPIPPVLDHDTNIHKIDGKYYISILSQISTRVEQTDLKKRVIALDPGVRKFLTGYDPSGEILEFGKGDMDRIHAVCDVIDRLTSRIAKEPNNKRKKRLKRAVRRLHRTIKNRIDDSHKKITKFLCGRYNIILLPVFETSNMVKKGDRKIGKKTAREMMTWSHYKFQQRLINKAREYNCSVKIVTEEYTSKTCGCCGEINNNLGSSEIFQCVKCSLQIDRDWNGARNILIRYFATK